MRDFTPSICLMGIGILCLVSIYVEPPMDDASTKGALFILCFGCACIAYAVRRATLVLNS